MKKYLNFLLLFLLMFTIVSRVNATSAEATRAYDAIR